MKLGTFTGKKLDDYVTLSKSDFVSARRIINGTDRADLIAGYAEQFDDLLKADGYGDEALVGPAPIAPPEASTPSFRHSRARQAAITTGEFYLPFSHGSSRKEADMGWCCKVPGCFGHCRPRGLSIPRVYFNVDLAFDDATATSQIVGPQIGSFIVWAVPNKQTVGTNTRGDIGGNPK